MSLTIPVEDRFWSKVDASGDCWEWTASRGAGGYGLFWWDRKSVPAHRWAWESLIGPIPDGLQLDHLCRVRHCVNPDHLEPVTPRENLMRGATLAGANAKKTRCKRGHPFDAKNTYHYRGTRKCKTCMVDEVRQFNRRRTALVIPVEALEEP